MYPIVYFDISGKCNARCPWCTTGRKNREGVKTGGFIEPDLFAKALSYMKEQGMLGLQTLLQLFSWGEPLLNPYFKEIVDVINSENLKFGISTNASKPIYFDKPDVLRNLNSILISMSGFSQNSYDRIHGFNFEKIKSNISQMLQNFREHGFVGRATMSYHIYQFNMDEIESAVSFAQEKGILFDAGFAYIADWEEYRKYLLAEMDYEKLKLASQNLFLFFVDEKRAELRASNMPLSSCPQHKVLSVDEDCNVVTCCLVDKSHKDYSIGNLFELTEETINHQKACQSICHECHDLGIWWLIQNPRMPKQILTLA